MTLAPHFFCFAASAKVDCHDEDTITSIFQNVRIFKHPQKIAAYSLLNLCVLAVKVLIAVKEGNDRH